jgi:hypothetical protein
VRTSGLTAGYNVIENEIELSGSFTVKLLGNSGPSIIATFPADNGIGIGPDGVDFNGSISASDLGVVPGLFTIKNLTLIINVQNSTLISIGGSAKVKLPSGVEVNGSFNIINGELDAAGNFVVVWIGGVDASEESRVFAHRFSADGSPLGNRFLISDERAPASPRRWR